MKRLNIGNFNDIIFAFLQHHKMRNKKISGAESLQNGSIEDITVIWVELDICSLGMGQDSNLSSWYFIFSSPYLAGFEDSNLDNQKNLTISTEPPPHP